MNKHANGVRLIALAVACSYFAAPVSAAPRENKGDSAAVLKLQSMVKSIAGERDAAKAEVDKLTAEIEQLRKDHSAAEAAKDALSGALEAQKSSAQDLRTRLDGANTKIAESANQNKELTQAKNKLNQELTQAKNLQRDTEQKLNTCGQHNVKQIGRASCRERV